MLAPDSMVVNLEKVEKRNGRPSLFTLVEGVPTSFLRKRNLCIYFNRGKCRASGTHGFARVTDRLLYHQCGACKKAGKADTSHGSHEHDRCPNRQIFRRK